MKDSKRYNRRSIRLKEYDYSQPGWYFITLCTYKSEILFGDISDGAVTLNRYGEIVDQYWKIIPIRYQNVNVDSYIIMPNHFHGIIHIIDDNRVGAIHESPLHKNTRRKMLLPKIIGFFKMNTAKSINKLRGKIGVSVWQRNYYEHVIRDESNLNRIRLYISENPSKWQHDEYFKN